MFIAQNIILQMQKHLEKKINEVEKRYIELMGKDYVQYNPTFNFKHISLK